MREGATIGAATVVNQTGEQVPDKFQAAMRAMMRATAEAHGKDTIIAGNDTTFRWRRDPLIAEAMVDERTAVPGVVDSGRVLSFTTSEAIRHGFCDGVAESVEEIIEKFLGFDKYELVVYQPTAWDNIKGFFMSSMIQGILIMLIIGGIYFELQTPGIGLPLGVAVLAAVLYFLPLYIDGLAANWEILLFIIGVGLLIVEIFVLPGFGVAGISGIILIVLGLVLSLVGNVGFDFSPVDTGAIGEALLTVMLGLLFGFGAVIYMSTKIGSSRGMFRKVALATALDNESGYIGVSMTEKELVGKTGTAKTVLRPSGKVEVESKVYDAVSEQSFIEKGATVRVVRYETGQIYVMEE
jgi:membrane-bound serine protease (ClpP class)